MGDLLDRLLGWRREAWGRLGWTPEVCCGMLREMCARLRDREAWLCDGSKGETTVLQMWWYRGRVIDAWVLGCATWWERQSFERGG